MIDNCQFSIGVFKGRGQRRLHLIFFFFISRTPRFSKKREKGKDLKKIFPNFLNISGGGENVNGIEQKNRPYELIYDLCS